MSGWGLRDLGLRISGPEFGIWRSRLRYLLCSGILRLVLTERTLSPQSPRKVLTLYSESSSIHVPETCQELAPEESKDETWSSVSTVDGNSVKDGGGGNSSTKQ